MKLTVVSVSASGFHIDQLREEAAKKGIEFNQINFDSLKDFENKLSQLGEVVLWRSSDLDVGVSRTLAMEMIAKKSHLINLGVGKYPFVTNKIYQQTTVAKYLDYASIPTFVFTEKDQLLNSINKGELKYPFIQKPNLGARGVDVRLIRSEKDLESNEKPYKNYVYQNFIKNNGDYRAFVLGGKILGVMKRVAQEGSILNNVSQGANAYVETDIKIVKEVRDIALKVSSLFELQMCGVDVIFDVENEKFFFLEVNTVPQWEGFSGSTGINVAEEIVNYCISLADESKDIAKRISNFFELNYKYLGAQKFHYASRLYLWTKKQEYREKLDALKPDLYVLENDVLENRIKRSLEDIVYKTNQTSARKKARREVKEKYPRMKKFSEIFTIHFFAKKLYGLDITSLVEKYVPDQEAVDLCNSIIADRETISKGSTTCVNYLYFAKEYFASKNIEINFGPELFLEISEKFYGDEEDFLGHKIYLLTHTIIGESGMYTRDVGQSEVILKILKILENEIQSNYGNLRLDMKLEFLVCAKLCNYQSFLEKIIISEVENSLSVVGDFIVDQGNTGTRLSSNLHSAEHRNVLYLMSKSFRSA